MRVLVACEFSGIVRDAFIAAGHDAVSCDLLPSERPGPHIQDDVLRHLTCGWDLLIAHPPCTYLANSGVRWLYGGKGTSREPDRWRGMLDASTFFARLLLAPIARIAVENPVMHRFGKEAIAEVVFPVLVTPDHPWTIYNGTNATVQRQTIQPWQFGHPETKATQLWRLGLPELTPTDIVDGRSPRVHYASPGPDRWKERSRTLPGLAAAMAAQWGSLPIEAAA